MPRDLVKEPYRRSLSVRDLHDLPIQSKRAGQAWADKFATLPPAEQARIISKAVVAATKARARRAGHPEPIFTRPVMKLVCGVYVLDHNEPLPEELGGTKRDAEFMAMTPEEQARTVAPDPFRKRARRR
jgi:hypothetical protein